MKSILQRTESERMIVDTIDDIVETYDHEYWYECTQSGEFIDELWAELADLGYLGVIIPEAYGGSEMSMGELGVVVERFARHGLPLLSLVNTATMAPYSIMLHGDEDLKERFLPKIAAGDLYVAFAITEPNAGTNSFKIETSATREGDHYVLNGQKTFVTGADVADYIQVVARTTSYDEVADKQEGGTIFAVETDSPGLEMYPLDLDLPEPMEQCSVYFDDVHVPVENRIGEEGKGFHHMFASLNPERITSASLSAGMADFVLDRGSRYAADRVVFDDPIGSYQAIQHPLTRAKINTELGKLAISTAVDAFESSDPSAGTYANIAKFTASEAANQALDATMQALGGNSLSEDYEVVRLQNWIRIGRIAPVNNEMILNQVARSLLNLPKSY